MAKAKKPGADFVIHVDVFNLQVAVYRTDEQRCATLRKHGVDPENVPGAAYATAHRDIGPDGQAWFGMVIKDEATLATWAHECVHIADYVMDHIGAPTDASNTEVRAYLVGHLFSGLQEALSEPTI